MKLLNFSIISFIMMLLAIPVRSENIKIHGRVIDREEHPIEFATVQIKGTAIGTNTDLKGQYSLTVAQKDTVEVVFSCIGFHRVTRRLIDPKGDITLNATLDSDETDLAELEVVGFRQPNNGMQSIDKESFKTSPDVSGGSIESMIQTMAGVNSSNEMSSQYSVRGGSFDENSVYINGVEIYRPQLVRSGQQEGLSIINPDMVGNIQFSTGGFPARYSDKMSSARDITYRQPEALEGALSLSLMGGSLTFGQRSNKFSQLHG
ncbi:MAG: TonB-dependent receptor, partial [Muribaculaceae bacterium]|nr:TonB-dependent receptor [Muribaculaceae bacterium]